MDCPVVDRHAARAEIAGFGRQFQHLHPASRDGVIERRRPSPAEQFRRSRTIRVFDRLASDGAPTLLHLHGYGA